VTRQSVVPRRRVVPHGGTSPLLLLDTERYRVTMRVYCSWGGYVEGALVAGHPGRGAVCMWVAVLCVGENWKKHITTKPHSSSLGEVPIGGRAPGSPARPPADSLRWWAMTRRQGKDLPLFCFVAQNSHLVAATATSTPRERSHSTHRDPPQATRVARAAASRPGAPPEGAPDALAGGPNAAADRRLTAVSSSADLPTCSIKYSP